MRPSRDSMNSAKWIPRIQTCPVALGAKAAKRANLLKMTNFKKDAESDYQKCIVLLEVAPRP